VHFFYLDETGDSGANLQDANQPIFVVGGISVRDEGWNRTQAEFQEIIDAYFEHNCPANFELHATDILCPDGRGHFAGRPYDGRAQLVRDIVDLVCERSHNIHYVALDKSRLNYEACTSPLCFSPEHPYLCAFDSLITTINWFVRKRLGSSARAMIIVDRKEQYHTKIEEITKERRFSGAAAHRIKWVVEFSYPIDSEKNYMIQLSDIIVYCIRMFLETEHGHRDLPENVKLFFAECYNKIYSRLLRATPMERPGRGFAPYNNLISAAWCKPLNKWRTRYGLPNG